MSKWLPIKIPRKHPKDRHWFEKIHALNDFSIRHREEWQEDGVKNVSGWAVMNHKGNLLPSTFSVGRKTAMKRCLEPAMQRFNGIVSSLFKDWEDKGYKVIKVKWEVE